MCAEMVLAHEKKHQNDRRWAHVCPRSELLVPGAMKGVNVGMEDVLHSALGKLQPRVFLMRMAEGQISNHTPPPRHSQRGFDPVVW